MTSRILNRVLLEGPIGITANGNMIAIIEPYVGQKVSPSHKMIRYMDALNIAQEIRDASIECSDVKGAEAMDYFIDEMKERLLGAGTDGTGGD